MTNQFICTGCGKEYEITWNDNPVTYEEMEDGVDMSNDYIGPEDSDEPIICPFCGEDASPS